MHIRNLIFSKSIILLILFFNVQSCFSQTPISFSSSELLLQLKKLNVLGSVLYIAAHPDDENTQLLAYLSKEKMCRTGYLSLTRGDGGQNLIGDEQGIELGLIRTQELLSARRVDGAEQFFTSAYDFGYSKSPNEALKIWNHDKILSDVVWVIRNFRPDLIICRFPTTGEGGHGQHTASAILAEEAFEAAADSSQFAYQLHDGLGTWKSQRLLWNTFNFGTVNTQKEDQLRIDIGGYNPLLGKSYGEIAASSRSQHKSQGFGVPAKRGPLVEYFKSIKGSQPESDLFEGIANNWNEIGHPEIQSAIDALISNFNEIHPEYSVNGLLDIYRSIINASTNFNQKYKSSKLEEIKNCIAACAGLFFEVTSNAKQICMQDSVQLNFVFNNRIGIPIKKVSVHSFQNISFDFDSVLKNKNVVVNRKIYLSNSLQISQPYWLKEKLNHGSYEVPLFDLGKPENDPINAVFEISFDGSLVLPFQRTIYYKFTDPIKGELYEPVSVVPAINILPESSLVVNSINANVKVKLTANRNIVITSVQSNGKRLNVPYQLKLKKAESIHVDVPLDQGINNIDVIEATHKYNQEMKSIHYDHIPDIFYLKPATILSQKIDVKIAGKKIGYIDGAGDKVKEMLEAMGYQIDLLTKKDINADHLKKYDAIITGVRAYNINEWLNEVYDVLMNYIKEGGVMLVQYNTSNSNGLLKTKIGPYPFTISKNRITDENAKVKLLSPNHLVFNYPNLISDADFMNWIQERSIYHATDIDSNYCRLLSMNDPDESADDGGLITANYGKGVFIYTGLSFFRQLPAGVSGAYRLFANLLAR